jgi:TolB-like protein
MIFSSSSSSSRRRGRTALLALALLAACSHGQRSGPTPLKLAVFPVQNAAGGAAPIRALTDALDAALVARGLEIVPRAELDRVLANYRLRFTGGVDRKMAAALREDLGADAVLVPTLELHAADAPPKDAIAVRLVGTGERPVVLWADAVARSGDDAPGLLSTGLVQSSGDLDGMVVAEVARRVAAYVSKRSPGDACGDAGRFNPRHVFRAPVLDDVGRRSIAVLPFINATSRRSAGDVIVGQFVAQLARSGAFEVVDPGLIREELLGHRIVLEGGVSVDNALALLSLLNADLVLSGYVRSYDARTGGYGTPKVEFTTYVLDRRTQELVWSSTSFGDGNDGVFFFGAGRVRTTSALSCRMVKGVVDRVVGRRGRLGTTE